MQISFQRWLYRFLVLGFVFGLYYGVQRLAMLEILPSLIHFPSTLSKNFLFIFQHHFWQFTVGMLVIIVASRGHLWSYGINAMNRPLGFSLLLQWCITTSLFIVVLYYQYGIPYKTEIFTTGNTIIMFITQFVSGPVADQIFFYGMMQTLIGKFWDEPIVISRFRISPAILFSTTLFAFGQVNIPFYTYNTILMYGIFILLGGFCGYVYEKTRSLLVPMFAESFILGIPLLVKMILGI